MAHSYVSTFHPSKKDIKRHKILKELRRNKDIVILKPDKGNGVVVLNKSDYKTGLRKIIDDQTKFKPLENDPTTQREAKLQRFLRKLKTNGHLDDVTYSNIYPTGSQPARIYGQPKMHETHAPNCNIIPPFRPIISSIGNYNYKLAKCLCSLLQPHIPSEHCAGDTFTFVREIQSLSMQGKHMVSFDVESLFTNIPLEESINLAVVS